MSKRVLLTGISGFIGSNAMEYILENTDWDVVGIASWEHKGVPTRISESKAYMKHKDRVTIITHDLVSNITNDLEDRIGKIDYIVHMASSSHVDRSISDPVDFVENNISSTLQVLEYARKHVPEVFIMFSTDEVYGANAHEEWDVLLPSNPYAASKASQEMICIAYWKTYGLPIVITNSNNIVGKNQDKEKFLPKIIDKLNKGEKITIHTSNGEPGTRYYNPVQNVADALLYILNIKPTLYSLDVDRPDRYSLPGGEELNNLQMAQMVAKAMGKELDYELIDAESVRPGYDTFYPKTDGKLSELGWEAPYTFEDELKKLVNVNRFF
jgi:dTDP-glucose 4,6-dehydratase